MTPERVPVDVALAQVWQQIGAFETAWDTMAPAPKCVLVLRGDGVSLREVASHLSITPHTGKP